MTSSDAELAVLLGLASAAGFAVSNALQHRTAGSVSRDVDSAAGVLAVVVRKPAWLAAMAVATAAVTLHASALKYGSVSMVQPLMVVGVVMAVLVRSALDLKLPTRPELQAVVITMGGLAVLVACAAPQPSPHRPAYGVIALLVAAGLGVAAAVLRFVPRMTGGPRAQAVLLSATSGLMFGLTAALMKLLGVLLPGNPTYAVPALAAVVCAGVLGIAMNQRAYQLAPLSLSMPVINLVDVLVAVLIGVVAFHELPAHSPVLLGLQAGALACLGLGVRAIARLSEPPAGSEPFTERTAS
jgi:hypothetical protein